MQRASKLALIGVAAVAITGAGTGIAVAASAGDDNEAPITGAPLDQASAVALDHTGQGLVTETEVDDEEGYYEVEVTLDDGSQVDVHLDRDLNVLGSEADGPGEDDGPNDD